ncbi:MAG: helix-turn-helix domain-containing protein [Alphaproteobacteria bacterium]
MRRDPAWKLFRLFGVMNRLVVFQRVSRRAQTASELAKELPFGRSAVVQHLAALKEAGLVDATSDGRRRVYQATPEGLAPLADWLTRYGLHRAT